MRFLAFTFLLLALNLNATGQVEISAGFGLSKYTNTAGAYGWYVSYQEIAKVTSAWDITTLYHFSEPDVNKWHSLGLVMRKKGVVSNINRNLEDVMIDAEHQPTAGYLERRIDDNTVSDYTIGFQWYFTAEPFKFPLQVQAGLDISYWFMHKNVTVKGIQGLYNLQSDSLYSFTIETASTYTVQDAEGMSSYGEDVEPYPVQVGINLRTSYKIKEMFRLGYQFRFGGLGNNSQYQVSGAMFDFQHLIFISYNLQRRNEE